MLNGLVGIKNARIILLVYEMGLVDYFYELFRI